MENFVLILDYMGVVVFAATGALIAAKKQLDLISFTLLSLVAGIGGGTMRDLLLGRLPVFWVNETIYLGLCVGTAAILFLIARKIHAYQRWLIWGDAIGIAVFTVIGSRIAHETGAGFGVCVVMGVMTAVLGGILRDVLAGEQSLVMRKEIYATACVIGSCVYLLLNPLATALAAPIGMAVTFLIRASAIHWRLQLPGYRWSDDVSEHRRSGD